MPNPVIVEAARTPIGRRGGWLSGVIAPKLLAVAQRGVLERADVDPSMVDQIIGGCVTQGGQQASNVTRNAWLTVGDNYSAAATTIDCQCGSGQQANNFMTGLIATGGASTGIACGVEQMSQVPLGTAARGGGGYYKDDTWPWDEADNGQFGAADRVAKLRGITREDLDAFGAASQQKAAVAWAEGRFEREVLAVEAPAMTKEGEPTGETEAITRDQGLRETTAESLAGLKPVIEGYLHTAGTASQISDGAAAVLWMDEEVAVAEGVRARARITYHTMVHEQLNHFISGFHYDAHPMAMMAGVVGSLAAFYHYRMDMDNPEHRMLAAQRMIAKMPTIAAACYRHHMGWPTAYPKNSLGYCGRFLDMMFSVPAEEYEVNPLAVRVINLLFILHADHEQNASTSTVRLVASTSSQRIQVLSMSCVAATRTTHRYFISMPNLQRACCSQSGSKCRPRMSCLWIRRASQNGIA
ncbi:MAG: hypothetical protein IH940_05390 [Acidobacteria bacterium]|nr:hypothetical protein [Acidobacteriota bacterium]